MKKTLKIGVLGPHVCNQEQKKLGLDVGSAIAVRGGILVCGGLGGMMEAAAEGAKKAGGKTVGILPGTDTADANPYIDLALPTGLGSFRNLLVVRSCDAVIAICGGYGTLTEIAFALRLGISVVGLKTWVLINNNAIDPGIHVAENPEEAVEQAFRLARNAH